MGDDRAAQGTQSRAPQSGKRKLFPVRLVDFETLRDWECFDADCLLEKRSTINYQPFHLWLLRTIFGREWR